VWRVPVQRAEPRRVTFWIYNGQPDPTLGGELAACAPADAALPDGSPIAVLCRVVQMPTNDDSGAHGLAAVAEGAPRAWSYTYDQRGQLLASTDPRGNVRTHEYYTDTTDEHTSGDLKVVTNALGQTTRYTRYDRSGRLLESIEPNGMVARSTYTARGWLSSFALIPSDGSAPRVSRYDYDLIGQVRAVTFSDGTTIGYRYDAAHRLVGIEDAAGNTVTYTLDATGNRVEEQTTDAEGLLAITISRAYDALNRLERVTGAPQ
jgi:YD repeat-containing protein